MLNPSAAPLRVAIVGGGFITVRGHIPAIQRHPETELAALVEVNPERGRALAAQFGIPALFTDYDQMLREVQPDLVIIATPNVFHAPMTIAALDAGAHVLCEKPMALSLADGQAMLAAAHRANRVLTIGLHNRFRPEMEMMKRIIDEGQLGRVYYAKASMLRRRGIPGFGSWFTNRDLAGGGALMDIGVHMVDLALWMMGNPRPVSVTGVTYSEFGPRRRALGTWGSDAPAAGAVIPENARFDVDDLAAGIVRFANGATLMVDVSWAAYVAAEERLQVLGSEAGADVFVTERMAPTQTPLKIYHDMAGRPAETYPVLPPSLPEDNPYTLQFNALVRHLRHGGPLRVLPEQALDVTAVLVALQESAATGRSVEVPSLG